MSVEVKNEIFLLRTAHCVYAFAVTKENLVRYLYWGYPVDMDDLPGPDQDHVRTAEFHSVSHAQENGD